MKCILSMVIGLLLAVTSANAQDSRFYLRGDIGLVLGTPSVETDTDPGSGGLGFATVTNSQEDDYTGNGTFNGASAPTTYDRADLKVHTIMLGLRDQL